MQPQNAYGIIKWYVLATPADDGDRVGAAETGDRRMTGFLPDCQGYGFAVLRGEDTL